MGKFLEEVIAINLLYVKKCAFGTNMQCHVITEDGDMQFWPLCSMKLADMPTFSQFPSQKHDCCGCDD